MTSAFYFFCILSLFFETISYLFFFCSHLLLNTLFIFISFCIISINLNLRIFNYFLHYVSVISSWTIFSFCFILLLNVTLTSWSFNVIWDWGHLWVSNKRITLRNSQTSYPNQPDLAWISQHHERFNKMVSRPIWPFASSKTSGSSSNDKFFPSLF